VNQAILYAMGGVLLLALGFYGVLATVDRLRRVISVNVMGTGVFLVLISLAARNPDSGPDPVLHAMVLTGIVVAVSASALGIALACRLEEIEADEDASNVQKTGSSS